MAQRIICPFCSTSYRTEYQAQYHIEEEHTDDSPFIPKDAASDGLGVPLDYGHYSDMNQTLCYKHDATASIEICSGQTTSLRDLVSHPETYERDDTTTVQPSRALRDEMATRSGRVRRQVARKSTRSECLSSTRTRDRPSPLQTGNGRLGRRELGQYAFEQSMPSSVRRLLEEAARPVIENQISKSGTLMRTLRYPNETSDLIPSFADLLARDASHDTVLCHPSVKHIHRVKDILTARPPDGVADSTAVEQAWSEGICSYGRQETGGIYNTRKWIGTHEALAFFTKIGVRCLAGSFKGDRTTGRSAATALLHFVQNYFSQQDFDQSTNVVVTSLAPIYLQRAGHSVTIIGFRRRKDTSELSLLAFDSSVAVSSKVFDFKRHAARSRDAEAYLQPYIKSGSQLARWDEYEVLTITDHSGLILREQDE